LSFLIFELNRQQSIKKLHGDTLWDVIVIGGGATGLGTAVDAASRGFKTLLLEQYDFAKGTSGRSTKLVHGGVRYLAQGNIKLVREALRERGRLLHNAPHVCHTASFLLPAYRWYDKLFYGIGLKMYDWLSGKWSLGGSTIIGRKKAMRLMPGVRAKGLRGGILYTDGQFDDARLAINLAQTAVEQGAVVLNYIEVKDILHEAGKVTGVIAVDGLSGERYTLQSKTVINATGVFADALMKRDEPLHQPMLTPSQGAHVVVEQHCFPAAAALMIPKTDDGRVLFAIPWHGRVVIGTTDAPVAATSAEPRPLDAEIDFIIQHFNRYSENAISRKDVKAAFAGLRPLVNKSLSKKTATISREHYLQVSATGLITITGGKWTTYRKMAEQVVDQAIKTGQLPATPCKTHDLAIHGSGSNDMANETLSVYGTDAADIEHLVSEDASLSQLLHPHHPYTGAQVVWAVRHEMAQTVEDFLARRIRLLLLDAAAAVEASLAVAAIMAKEMGETEAWQQQQVKDFAGVGKGYLV
jgi:glycerol-3-phosphate dehydrogenase